MTLTMPSQIAKHQTRFFTLIETIIVLFLISLVSIGVGYHTYRSVQKERFNKGVSLLLGRLHMGQNLMMLYGLDVDFILTPHEKGTACALAVTGIAPEEMRQLSNYLVSSFSSKKLVLENLYLTFEDEERSTQINPIHIVFKSSGGEMTKGKIRIFETKERSEDDPIFISFRGYPKQVFTASTKEELPDEDNESAEGGFPHEI